MQTFLQDLRFAIRLLWKSPGFTVVAIVALALGIGANTAIFSVVNSVLLRPLPFRNADRMAIVWESSKRQGWDRMGTSGPTYLDFRNQSKSVEDLALMEPGSGTVTGFGEPQQLPAMRPRRVAGALGGLGPASLDRSDHDFGVIGHLKPDISAQQANTELNALEGRIREQFVWIKDWGVTAVPLQDALTENVWKSLSRCATSKINIGKCQSDGEPDACSLFWE